MRQIFIFILLLSCEEKDLNVPGGTSTQSQEEAASSNSFDCPEQWGQDDEGTYFDPVACVAWSALSPELTWHETVSVTEANDGGCDQFCDLDEVSDYCANLEQSGLQWKTPTIDQLKGLTTRQPPFDDADYDLWSRTSDPVDELAWTANIEQAGMEISLYKTSQAYVRCIAE